MFNFIITIAKLLINENISNLLSDELRKKRNGFPWLSVTMIASKFCCKSYKKLITIAELQDLNLHF